jgi:hypothetical protein
VTKDVPLTKARVAITESRPLKHHPFEDWTLGATIERHGEQFRITYRRTYADPNDFVVEVIEYVLLDNTG